MFGKFKCTLSCTETLVNTHCRTMQSRAISSTVNPRVYTKLLNRKKTFAWVMHVHTEPITRPISRTVNLENIASSLFSQGYENNYIFISLRNTAWKWQKNRGRPIWMIISSLLYISPCRDFAHYLSDTYIAAGCWTVRKMDILGLVEINKWILTAILLCVTVLL